jgi:TonB-linked SusC/RagA family outer membrane protein
MKKIVRTALFLITLPVAVLAQNSPSPNSPVTVQKKTITIGNALKEIEKQTGYFFVFSKEDLDVDRKIVVQAENEKLQALLFRLFSPLRITCVFLENNIILKKQTAGKEEVPQNKPVINSTKPVIEPAPPEKEEKKIDEVVVIGYGTNKRTNVTGAVTTVAGNRLVQAHAADLSNALAGNLAGLRTVQKSGRPGYDGSIIDIRGYGDDFLTIVDGVERPFSQIDPHEIESVSILKDASAAVYGYKSANGVLIITTKKGTTGRPEINYNFNYARQSITRYPEYMDVWEYMNSYNEAILNVAQEGEPPFTPGDIQHARNTHWQKAVLKDFAPMKQHNLNITGGSESTNYFISFGYLNQDGILRTEDSFKRYNFRSNISALITKRFNAEMQISGRREVRDAPATVSGGGNGDNFSQSIFKNMAMALPYQTVYANNNPSYYNHLESGLNPVALLNRDCVGTDLKQYGELNGQLILNCDLPFIDGLSLKVLTAYDKQTGDQRIFKKTFREYSYYPTENRYVPVPVNPTAAQTEHYQQNDRFNQQYSVSYKNTFGKHTVSGLCLWEIRRAVYRERLSSGEFDISPLPGSEAVGMKNQLLDGTSYKTAGMGIIGRINYSFDNTYLLELSFREDGVSKFAAAGRWAFTSGISAGWRIFDNLKLRASYGLFPLTDRLDETCFLPGYSYPGRDIFGSPVYFVQGENNTIVSAFGRGIVNPSLTWEKVSVANMGVEASFGNGRFHVEWDGFFRRHTGMYFTRTLPTSFGGKMPDENLNSESDRGLELVVGSKQRINDWCIDLKATYSYARKKREYQELPEAGNQYAAWAGRYQESDGRIAKNPYRWDNIAWGYEALGQFQNYREIIASPIQDGQGNTTLLPGDIRYKDVNEDGLINDLDLLPIGRSDRPEIFFGFNLSVVWKNIDWMVFFQGAANYTYTFNYKDPFVQGGMGNGYRMYSDRWRRVDVNDPLSDWVAGYFPPLRVESYTGNQAPSTFWNKNTAYLRLKTIDCGYTLPQAVTAKAGIRKLRIYVNAYNLWVFSRNDLKYVDPEGESGYGIYYPQMKAVSMGVNIEF